MLFGLVRAGGGLDGAEVRAEAPPERSAEVISPRVPVDEVVDFWRAGDGLPHDTVSALLQTRDRYLWVGTDAGLARFDGQEFTQIGDETLVGLEGARVTALLEDREGWLWVGTRDQGVFRVGSGQGHRFAPGEGAADRSVSALAQDEAGRIWIGTQGGLHRWEEGETTRYASEVLPSDEAIIALHAGRSGTLWVTTRLAVYQLRGDQAVPFEVEDLPTARNADFRGVYEDREGDLWTYGATFLLNLSRGQRINYFRSLDPASSRVWTICEQSDGTLWVGTSGRGLFRFRDDRFDIVGSRDGLDQCDVRALVADDEGNLWVGTNGSGLARLRARSWVVLGVDAGLSTGHLTTVATNAAGRILVGTSDAGVMVLRGQRFEPLGADAPLRYAGHIRSICTDRTGALWVGTYGAGLFRVVDDRQWHLTTADGLSDNMITALAEDPSGGGLWVGTEAGVLHRVSDTGLRRWTMEDGMTGRSITCMLPARDGSLIIGAEADGLVEWRDGQVSTVPAPPGVHAAPVWCLLEDRSQRLWVGTAGGGAYCRLGTRWTLLNARRGLASDWIAHIQQDEDGNLWFSSDVGVFRVSAREIEALLAGETDAVRSRARIREEAIRTASRHQGWPGSLSTPDGTLWFAAGGGLMAVDPDLMQAPVPPRVVIERVLADGRPVDIAHNSPQPSSVRLGPGTRSLDFHFTAVSLTAPGRIVFRHRLAGFDADWVPDGPGRHVHYGPVPPGRYQFQLMAGTIDGIWYPSGPMLDLIIAHPFWQSWWFLLLAGTAAIAFIWALVRFLSLRHLHAQLRRSEQKRAMEKERSRIARDMHDEIGSKLTRISFLSEVARHACEETPGAATPVEAIATASRELLQALDEIVWVVNPRNDDLEHLAGYLEQYAREYFQPTPVDCEISIPQNLPEVPLPTELRHNVFLAFEEALGNVLKHSAASRVEIAMSLAPGGFDIVVDDDGQGLPNPAPAQPPGHDGLGNMKARLDAVGGWCQIGESPTRGTRVRLRFYFQSAAAGSRGALV